MIEVQSKLSSQGQVSVPAEVRKHLHLRPGSVLTWRQEGERIVVERARRHASAEVHAALFPGGPPAAPAPAPGALKEGIRAHLRRRHAGR
jgi:AbrB family looped-hinge helix DNA binding protein